MHKIDNDPDIFEKSISIFTQYLKNEEEMIAGLARMEEEVSKIREMVVAFLKSNKGLNDNLSLTIQLIASELGGCVEQVEIAQVQIRNQSCPWDDKHSIPWVVQRQYWSAKTILQGTIKRLELSLELDRVRQLIRYFQHMIDTGVDPDTVKIVPEEESSKSGL